MAVKTITIDMEAYEALARLKKQGQSFSEVIKEHLGAARTGRNLQEAIAQNPLLPSTLARLEERLRRRKASRATSPKL